MPTRRCRFQAPRNLVTWNWNDLASPNGVGMRLVLSIAVWFFALYLADAVFWGGLYFIALRDVILDAANSRW